MVALAGIGTVLYSSAAQSASADQVIVYYFHGSFRCATCTNMEQYSKETLQTNFKDALASGKMTFKSVNVEEPGNKHFVDEYKLYTKALILSQVKNAKEVRSKNLEKIWEYAHNKQAFTKYVDSEVKAFMKGGA